MLDDIKDGDGRGERKVKPQIRRCKSQLEDHLKAKLCILAVIEKVNLHAHRHCLLETLMNSAHGFFAGRNFCSQLLMHFRTH